MDKLDKKLYPNVIKIYGPYRVTISEKTRQQLVFHKRDGSRSSKSYPKYLMERYLKRNIEGTIDRINGDPLDNEIGNLRIISRSVHTYEDCIRYVPQSFVCPWCGGYFTLEGSKLHHAIQNRKKNKAGPFCSRRCAGKYGAAVKHGKIEPFDIKLVEPKYTTIKNNIGIKKIEGLGELSAPQLQDECNENSKHLKPAETKGSAGRKLFKKGGVCAFCWTKLTVRKRRRANRNNIFCSRSCSSYYNNRNKTKIVWPPTEELVEKAEEIGFSALGRELGVSDNAIRKRIRNH